MKATVSVDDALVAQADAMARELGMSRSGLVAQALREYLARRRGELITEQLNRVYAKHPITEDERRVMRKMRTMVRLSPDDQW